VEVVGVDDVVLGVYEYDNLTNTPNASGGSTVTLTNAKKVQ